MSSLNSISDLDLDQHFKPSIQSTDLAFNFKKSGSLKILYLNSRSLANKTFEIEQIISSKKAPVHLIAITETWLNEDNCKYVNISNFTPIHSCRPTERGGGVAFYIRSNLQFDEIDSFSDDRNSLLHIKVKINNKYQHIVCVYRQPNTTTALIDEFLSMFYTFILRKKYRNVLILGDFNFNLINRKVDNNVRKYEQLIKTNNYFFFDKCTITRTASNSLLDHILTNNISNKFSVYYVEHDISDHKLIFIEIDNVLPKVASKDSPGTKIKLNMDKLKRSLVSQPIVITNLECTNNVYDEYSNELKNHLSRSSTLSKPKPKIQTQIKNWITDELLRTINAKNFWHKKMKENIRNSEAHETEPLNDNLRVEYSYWKRKVNRMKNNNYNHYYKSRFESNTNNPIQTWTIIKEIAYEVQKNSEPKLSILHGNSPTTDSVQIVEIFNDFFVNIGKDMSSGIVSNYDYGLNDYGYTSFSEFLPLSDLGVGTIVKRLKNTNSLGYDQISSKVIKECYIELKDCLKTVINQSLLTGIFPDNLKITKTVAIYKSGSKSIVNNYRPIAISSNGSKLIETAVKDQLKEHLEDNNILYNKQYGFRSKSNTQTALFDMVSSIQSRLDRKQNTSAIFFDLSKAFDTVDLPILLNKLSRIGIGGTVHNWFKSFLTQRKQYVQYDSQMSTIKPIDCGVPQGSILGPILFLIYTNDLKDIGLNGEAFMYADDLVLIYSNNTLSDLEQEQNADLIKLERWVTDLKLTVNVNKTKYMLFNKDASTILNLFYKNAPIEKVECFKHLGLHIDYKLNWNAHIDRIKGKLAAVAGIFRRLQTVLPKNIKVSVYHSLFHSHIIYGLVVWGGATKFKIKEVQTVENRAIKNLFGYQYLTSTEWIHSTNKLLTILQQYKYQTSLLVHNILNNNIHTNTTISYRSHHHHRTFRDNPLSIPQTNTVLYGSRSCVNQSILNYNALPSAIKVQITSAKEKIKNHYLQDSA